MSNTMTYHGHAGVDVETICAAAFSLGTWFRFHVFSHLLDNLVMSLREHLVLEAELLLIPTWNLCNSSGSLSRCLGSMTNASNSKVRPFSTLKDTSWPVLDKRSRDAPHVIWYLR